MSRRFFAQRTTSPPTSKSRAEYLSRRGSFCALLEEFSPKPWVTVVLGPGWLSQVEREEAMAAILRRLAGALGSIERARWLGDLPDGSDIVGTTQRYAADMAADRLSIVPSVDMAQDHLAGRVAHGGDAADAWVVKVLVTTMLTTNLYFTLRALDSASTMHRSGHEEEAAEPIGTTALWAHRQLTARVIMALEAVAEELDAGASGARALAAHVLEGRNASDLDTVTERFLASFRVVVDTIRHTLEPSRGAAPRLARADVRALTELAWFSLSSFAEDTYPGWHDLLLELSHYDQPEHGLVGRPSFDNVMDASEAIRARYLRLTSISWRRTRDPGCKPSTKVHDAVAALLHAQATVRESLPAGSTKAPPPAVAHVTSFDLELEMALLRGGHPFHVVFPVHVVDTFNNLLHVRWCMLDVDGRDLQSVLRPGSEAVRMLDGRSRELTKARGPIVVRLTGCPLIDLPPMGVDGWLTSLGEQVLGSQPDERGRATGGDKEILNAFHDGVRKSAPDIDLAELQNRKARQVTMRHAVIVSEHDAMLQNAMDSQPWSGGESLCRRLPVDTVADNWGWRRFWMLLGVQVGDNAIRQRVSHVVAWYPASDTRSSDETPSSRRDTGARTRGQEPDGHERHERGIAAGEEVATGTGGLGLLVSRHVGHIEQDLLYWNRFDIVENADAHLFAEDLQHIADQHLHPADRGAMIRCPDV